MKLIFLSKPNRITFIFSQELMEFGEGENGYNLIKDSVT